MVSSACVAVLCFALATLTFGAPNVDFANFDVASQGGVENQKGHINTSRSSPVLDSGAQSQRPQGTQGVQSQGSQGGENQGAQGAPSQQSQAQANQAQGHGNQGQGQGTQGGESQGAQGQGNSGQGSQGQGNQGQDQGNQGQGQGNQGQGNGNQGQGSQGQGNQGQGSQGQGNQGQGQGNQGQGQGNQGQGNGNQGQGNQGQGNQGQGNQGQGNQGQGQGNQGQGNGNQGQGNQGRGNQGQGNQGQGSQGQGNQGQGQGNQGQGQGSQGQGNQGQGQGSGNQGQGNQGQGNQGNGNQGQGNQGNGNQGQGNQGQGNQGNGNQGQGNQGNGNQGNGNQGQGNQGQNPPAPKKVFYEFGTKSKYDVLISPENEPPFVAAPSKTPLDYSANAKYTDAQNRKITYVTIETLQTGEGSANIVEGAIGASSVNVAIVAKGSLSYQHVAKFYTSPLQYNIVSLGNSTAKDVVLARVKNAEQYSGNTSPVRVVKYPGTTEKLKDKKPTYVVVTSKQTSNKLSAAITKGDLKKPKDPLEVTLTAGDTMEFEYEVVFYSSAARSQPLFFTAAVSLLVFLWSRIA